MPTLYTSLSNTAYTTITGDKRVIAFVTGPRGPAGSGAGNDFNPSGYITTGQADLRYYPLDTNPSGFLTGFDSGNYVTKSETGQFYPNSNPSGFSTSDQLAQTGTTLNTKINSLSGYVNNLSGNLQINLNVLSANLQATGSALYTLITGTPTPSGFITTGQADARYYAINNPSGYITGFNSGQYITNGQTGQFYPNSNPNSFATSGNLALTGTLITSSLGVLSGFTTGISGNLQNQINLLPTSSNLALTGSSLYSLITGLSGYDASVYATIANLVNTGSQLFNSLNNNAINLSGVLTQSGIALIARDLVISGVLDSRILGTGTNAILFASGLSGILQSQINSLASSANLTATGSNLFNIITGFSGQANTNFATIINLQSTGQQIGLSISGASGVLSSQIALTGSSAWNAANNNGINLSGNLTQTGSILNSQNSALSGFLTGVSGYLSSLIQGSVGGVSSINGQSGVVSINGAGNITVTTGSNTITISGNTGAYANFATVINLSLTGLNLYNLITGASGQANTDFATKISLTQSGATLGSQINSLSGFSTGLSGFLQSQIVLTGQANSISANNNAINLSGQLTLTGQSLISAINSVSGGLETRIAATGAANIIYSNSIAANLSGALAQSGILFFARDLATSGVQDTKIFNTGSTLDSKINTLSGYTNNISGVIQSQITILNNNTGLYYLNTNPSGFINTLSGLSTGFITGISGVLQVQISSTNSNLNGLSGVFDSKITATGVSLSARDLAISGALQAQIGAGGAQIKVTGSASIAIADFTGIGTTIVFYSGNQIFISGAQAGAGAGDVTQAQLNSLSGWTNTNLSQTGSNLYNLITGLSGSITGGGGSSATWTEMQIDFGSGKPVYDKTFIITDSSVSVNSKIVVLPCGKTASGQQDGDWLWDGLTLAALPGTGSFTLFAAPVPGPIKGKRVIQYQITI
jgi:hypothetical protein